MGDVILYTVSMTITVNFLKFVVNCFIEVKKQLMKRRIQ